MATTFADVSKSSATNYLFLFAQRALALQNTSPTPPPLNALGLPCEAMCLLWRWLHPEIARQTKKALERKRSLVFSEKAAEKIAPHAKKITEYILNHQDDAAQEDNWRTSMKRDTMKRFNEQRKVIDDVHSKLDDMHSRLNELVQFSTQHSKVIDHPSAEEATIEVNMVGGTNDPDDEERPRMPEGKVEPRSQSLDECQRPNAEEEARLEA